MGQGGWEWQADRGRWVAHAPGERATVVIGVVALVGQLFMVATAHEDSLVRNHPWTLVPWLLVGVPWTVAQLGRIRRAHLTYDGEVIEVHGLLVRTRFRRDDIGALWVGPAVAPHLPTVRVRRPERTVAGVRLPHLRRTTSLTPLVPDWWWHQIVGVPPEALELGPLRRAWARLRGRPVGPVRV